MGGRIDKQVNSGSSPPIFRLNGQNFHLMGSLLPTEGNSAKFAQLYIHDSANEVMDRISAVRNESDVQDLHPQIVADIQAVLDECNVLVKSFRMAKEAIQSNPIVEVKMKLIGKRNTDARTYNLPTVSEVAALIVGDLDAHLGERDILVETKSGLLKRISELNPAYLPLQYPLLFPYGEDGYREDIGFNIVRVVENGSRQRISPREYLAFRIHERSSEVSTILYARRLFQQFLVDGYTMVEAGRLLYIRTNQKSLRCGAYQGLSDALTRGDIEPGRHGKRVILPSSFTGGARYMIQNYQDALAICGWIGYPNLFITFTCNPKWPEIERYLGERHLSAVDRPDIICRLFKMKLDALIKEIRSGLVFGNVTAVIYTVEFQKRGLPHAHILVFLSQEDGRALCQNIDTIISAEIPDQEVDSEYYRVVEEFMIHGPCGHLKKNSPCMVNGRCSKHFPKKFVDFSNFDQDGYPIYRRREDGRFVKKNGIELDNRFVVPHNKYLLLKYRAHINIEWCNQSRSIKYLFKYVNKGHDRVTAHFYKSSDGLEKGQIVDEISMFYDCRYISACEGTWRLFGFDIQFRVPAVERLSFHLPNQQLVVYGDDDCVDNILSRPSVGESMFLAWFEANKKFPKAKELTYGQMPNKFVWKKDVREWHLRRKGFAIGRMFFVPPGSGEIYYLRCLLNLVRGATCYEDLRIVEGVQYSSFRDACFARGLLADDKEYVDAINEASKWASATSMRRLFVTMLTSNVLIRPEVVWDAVWIFLAEDAEFNQRKILDKPGLTLTDEEKANYALVEIEKLLRVFGKSISCFPSMPLPNMSSSSSHGNQLLDEELSYDCDALKVEHDNLVEKLTDEQRHVYDVVLTDVANAGGGLFFVYGYGGTGKTFVWKTLSAALRSEGHIVLTVASSGIASLLLPGGRTAHSRFAIPINITEDSTCNISQGSDLAHLIINSKLIIWDEAPMMHKHCFEALDRTMRDLLRFVNPLSTEMTFGGKTVVLGGDFRQILPVIPKGTRQDIVGASINSSYLWQNCKVLRLTKNLRLQRLGNDDSAEHINSFSEWIAGIGDGLIGGPNDGCAVINIPEQNVLRPRGDSISAIVNSTFPEFCSGNFDMESLNGRAILAPTLDLVHEINDYMSGLNTTAIRTYFSSDSVCQSDSGVDTLAGLHTTEFLNTLKCSGIPNHCLMLQVGSPVMLLRNIDYTLGLCNGMRLVITRLGDHVVEAKVMSGSSMGTRVLIPRLSLTPSDPRLPFKFQRRQFPLMLSYAMTINKSQGQSLTNVGLLLKKPVFVHGQLYVALSRVDNPNGLKVVVLSENGEYSSSTVNVVYHEVFKNL